jgi:hypothetical protein
VASSCSISCTTLMCGHRGARLLMRENPPAAAAMRTACRAPARTGTTPQRHRRQPLALHLDPPQPGRAGAGEQPCRGTGGGSSRSTMISHLREPWRAPHPTPPGTSPRRLPRTVGADADWRWIAGAAVADWDHSA